MSSSELKSIHHDKKIQEESLISSADSSGNDIAENYNHATQLAVNTESSPLSPVAGTGAEIVEPDQPATASSTPTETDSLTPPSPLDSSQDSLTPTASSTPSTPGLTEPTKPASLRETLATLRTLEAITAAELTNLAHQKRSMDALAEALAELSMGPRVRWAEERKDED